MADWPGSKLLPQYISTFTSYFTPAGQGNLFGVSLTTTTLTWVANLAMYMPFELPWDYQVKRVFWCNGATTTSNGDLGVYTLTGQRLMSTGSIARSGADTLQFTTVDWVIEAGSYYLGVACAGTTTSLRGATVLTAPMLRATGVLQQATALPLPATATFAAATNALYPLAGFTRIP